MAVLTCGALMLSGCGSGHGPAASITRPTRTTSPGTPRLRSVAWRATVDGAVYAQPVVAGKLVFVATEDDEVYALSLETGRVRWHASIGSPLTHVAAYAGCGNIDPLGITSTPVADPANGTIYVVGEVTNGAHPPAVHRELVGFDMATGAVVRTADADPANPGGPQVDLQQRAGLAIDGGRVDVGFGGLAGDCGEYHGWLVGVGIDPGATNVELDTTPGGSGGAIWQGGAPPAVGPHGALYVVTGNQNSQGRAGYYESAIELSPTLVPSASFRDPLATGDEDFGTSGPLLLPGGGLLAVGKTDVGYVLTQSGLRLLARIPGICGSNPDGRLAFDAALDAAYVPCRTGGIQEVRLARDRLGWRSGAVNSSPIFAGGALWALSYPGGTLQALNPATGSVEQTTHVGRTANFATPAFANDRLVVATATGRVEAFGR